MNGSDCVYIQDDCIPVGFPLGNNECTLFMCCCWWVGVGADEVGAGGADPVCVAGIELQFVDVSTAVPGIGVEETAWPLRPLPAKAETLALIATEEAADAAGEAAVAVRNAWFVEALILFEFTLFVL